MYKLILIILFSLPLSISTSVAKTKNEYLLNSIKEVFTEHQTHKAIESLISKGVWNIDNTAFAVSGKVGETVYIYAFLKEDNHKFTHVKLWDFEMNQQLGKLGRPLDYYDRYQFTPRIYSSLKKTNKLYVGYRLRTWKNGQRYTVDYKAVGIRPDKTLDWSQY